MSSVELSTALTFSWPVRQGLADARTDELLPPEPLSVEALVPLLAEAPPPEEPEGDPDWFGTPFAAAGEPDQGGTRIHGMPLPPLHDESESTAAKPIATTAGVRRCLLNV